MKFSYTKNLECDFFKKNPNLTKKKQKFWRLGREGWGCGFFLFSKEAKSEKNVFFF